MVVRETVVGYVEDSSDCNDTDSNLRRSDRNIDDGIDQDCDGLDLSCDDSSNASICDVDGDAGISLQMSIVTIVTKMHSVQNRKEILRV